MSVETILNWAIHTGISVSLLILLVLVVRRPFTRKFGARAAYWLWVLPLIRLALPEMPLTVNLPSWLASAPKLPNDAVVPIQFEAVVYSPAAAQINWQTPVLVVWIAVAIIWLAAQIIRQRKFLKFIGETSVAAPKSVQVQAAEICRTLNISMPDIRLAATNTGPLVTGMFRPVIVLPQNFEEDFNDRQQHFALMHELAHIKRRDLWTAFGALVFRALNWPNPLVHVAAAKFRIDQEAACDAYVLNVIGGGMRTKRNYAATLIHSAKLTTNLKAQAQQTSPLCLTIYHPLKERLMTLKTSKTNSTILSRIGAGALLVTAFTLTAPVTIAAGPETPQPPAIETDKTKTKTKKVMKWVENVDGVETAKHIEITVEDGVTTAYSIDEHGNKTVFDASEIKITEGMSGRDQVRLFMALGDKASGENTRFLMNSDLIHMEDGDAAQSTIVVVRLAKDADGNIVNRDTDILHMTGGLSGGGAQASMMVGAAKRLLEQAEKSITREKELSAKTRRKLDKARKALAEAQEALEAEE